MNAREYGTNDDDKLKWFEETIARICKPYSTVVRAEAGGYSFLPAEGVAV